MPWSPPHQQNARLATEETHRQRPPSCQWMRTVLGGKAAVTGVGWGGLAWHFLQDRGSTLSTPTARNALVMSPVHTVGIPSYKKWPSQAFVNDS